MSSQSSNGGANGHQLDARAAFGLDPAQQDLRRNVQRFVADRLSIKETRRLMDTPGGFDRSTWQSMASELGLQGIAIPEKWGGAGATEVELAIAVEELGSQLAGGPFLANAIATFLLLESHDEHACEQWLPGIAAGQTMATLALAESESWEPDRVSARVSGAGSQQRLDGGKTFVLDGDWADLLLVAARSEAGTLGVYAVERHAPGLHLKTLSPLDLTRRMADVQFDGVPAVLIATQGEALVTRVLDFAAMLLAAECVGAAQHCLDISVEHGKTRRQFGRPIGSFQALKHLCADMLVAVEFARSAANYAAWAAAERSSELAIAAPLAKAHCSEAFYNVAAATIQLHGGMGFTWEHDAHLYFKRATSSLSLLGGTREFRDRLATRIGI